MPVWGAGDLEDAGRRPVAYLRAGLPAVPYADAAARSPGARAPSSRAWPLYVRYGCVNCHGPTGSAAYPNPQSPDKTIPPLSGQDFRKEFNTDAKILAVDPLGQRDR